MLEWLIGQARIKVSVVQNRWYEGNGFDWGSECMTPDFAS
jgi:hypothetical protein